MGEEVWTPGLKLPEKETRPVSKRPDQKSRVKVWFLKDQHVVTKREKSHQEGSQPWWRGGVGLQRASQRRGLKKTNMKRTGGGGAWRGS